MPAPAAPADRPLDAAAVSALVAAAAAAPSIHNTQPWSFRFDERARTLRVYAARGRALPATDPSGRALHVSVGAALFNLRVAAHSAGFEPLVRLLPREQRGDANGPVLATVRLAPRTARRSAAYRPGLYEALWRRHSSRRPFSGAPVPAPVRTELAEAARVEGATLTFTPPRETARLLAVTAAGEQRTAADPARGGESRRWVEQGAHGGRFGLPPEVLGPADAGGRLPVRDFTAAEAPRQAAAEPFEELPLVAALATEHDRPVDWLRAGQALEHVLLTATVDGLRASLFHQALEWPDLRASLRRPGGGPQHPQMLLRLGYGTTRRASLRAPVRTVLRSE